MLPLVPLTPLFHNLGLLYAFSNCHLPLEKEAVQWQQLGPVTVISKFFPVFLSIINWEHILYQFEKTALTISILLFAKEWMKLQTITIVVW